MVIAGGDGLGRAIEATLTSLSGYPTTWWAGIDGAVEDIRNRPRWDHPTLITVHGATAASPASAVSAASLLREDGRKRWRGALIAVVCPPWSASELVRAPLFANLAGHECVTASINLAALLQLVFTVEDVAPTSWRQAMIDFAPAGACGHVDRADAFLQDGQLAEAVGCAQEALSSIAADGQLRFGHDTRNCILAIETELAALGDEAADQASDRLRRVVCRLRNLLVYPHRGAGAV